MRLALTLLLAASAFAAVTQNTQQLGTSPLFVVSMNWTAEADGSVAVTPAVMSPPTLAQGYRVFSVETAPGSPAPTNGYTLKLTDPLGTDLLGGSGISLSSTTAQYFAGLNQPPPLFGTFSLTITNNLVSGASGKVLIFLAPITQVLINASPGPAGPTLPYTPIAFASAAACSTATVGTLSAFTDSSTIIWGATITGGGTGAVLGYCDGTNWTVAAK